MKAMILAAGRGTRLLPLTEKKPKALIEVQGITLLEHTIRYLKFFGIDEMIINIHHHAGQIVDFLKKHHSFGAKIDFSNESEELLDTGGGLYKARWFFTGDQPVILTSCDVITSLDLNALFQYHQKNDPLVTLAVKHRPSSRDFIFDQGYRLCGWHNNVTGETRMVRDVEDPVKIAFSTIHVINPALFKLINERGCFSIINVYLRLALNYAIMGFEHDHAAWYECGRLDNLDKLNQEPEIKNIYHAYHR